MLSSRHTIPGKHVLRAHNKSTQLCRCVPCRVHAHACSQRARVQYACKAKMCVSWLALPAIGPRAG
eukprot:1160943-Pelagomonas_calceolata.AAC.4